jgi:hypothetical protein
MIARDSALLAPRPVPVVVQWFSDTVDQRLLLKRADKLLASASSGSFQIASCLERHHVELCMAGALREMYLTGDVSAVGQPCLDAYAFANLTCSLHQCLTPLGQRRHQGKLKDALRSDFGFASYRAEQYGILLGLRIGCDVNPVDMEGAANFDFEYSTDGDILEVECKLLTHDFGTLFRRSEFHRLCRELEKRRSRLLPEFSSKIAWLTLSTPLPRESNRLAELATAICDLVGDQAHCWPGYVVSADIELWSRGLIDPTRAPAEARFLMLARHRDTFSLHGANAAFILAMDLQPIDLDRVRDRMVRKFKDAAGQLTGIRPGIIYAEVEGPSIDRSTIRQNMQVFRYIMPEVFKTRPHLEGVVIGFPGPPFSPGGSFLIRNDRKKRRNMSLIARRLERLYKQRRKVDLPFEDFRTAWWREKYKWDYKTESDFREAAEKTASEMLRAAKEQHRKHSKPQRHSK